MTREEAIWAMRFYKEKLYNGIFNQYIGAFDVAISALREQEELAQNLHGVASNKQVTEPLRHNGFKAFEVSLVSGNQVTSDKTSDWISVEDRLPDHPNKVLIYSKSGKYGVGKYIERMDCFIATGQTVVTHWMELPEPPEVST